MANQALEFLYPRSMKYLSDTLQGLIRGRLWLKMLLGMLLGLLVGILLGPATGWVAPNTATTIGNWLAFPGQLFLALLQMIVIPLVFASIIRGLAASENFEQLKQIGLRLILFIVLTTAVATAIGLSLGLLIKPGHSLDAKIVQQEMRSAAPIKIENAEISTDITNFPQKVITLLPGNPLNSMAEGQMLEVVIFALLVGVALVTMPPTQAKPMLDLLGSLQEVCMTVVRWAMIIAPFAVFGLLAQLTMKIGIDILLSLLIYVFTVLLGLFTLLMIFLALVAIITKMSPKNFLLATRDVLVLAFSTSSSAAVMPLSIKAAEEKLGVRPSIAQIVIPLGATINMNGTALYQGVATIFLAQIFGIELTLASMVLVVFMAVGASIGSPGTPGVGIIILAMVLSSVGVPTSGIALIMGVDRILDMCRTVINVAGDLVACRIMERWVGGEKTPKQALAAEKAREKIRQKTGEDVIIAKSK